MADKMKRVLIICPQPYYDFATSRTLKTYFDGWDESCIAQIYSDPKKPGDGFCFNYYQITDKMMLNRANHGEIYNRSNYKFDSKIDVRTECKKRGILTYIKKKDLHKTSIAHIARTIIWKKSKWNSKSLNEWLDEFKPEVIHFTIGDDTYIYDMAEYIAKKYNIPIITYYCDDFYFNNKFALSPFSHIYRKIYEKRLKKIVNLPGKGSFCCDLMMEKYCEEFGVTGKVIYTYSEVEPSMETEDVNSDNLKIAYLGNLSLGRYKSLIKLGQALFEVSPKLHIDVYSKLVDEKIINKLNSTKGILFHGAVDYQKVLEVMKTANILIHTEDFEKNNMERVKYSLSTKIADSLSSGSCLLAYGSKKIGSIDYLIKNDCAFVITEEDSLTQKIETIINNKELRISIAKKGLEIAENNHRLEKCKNIFSEMVETI